MSQSIQAFTLGEIAVRQLNGLFSLNDLHRAAGAARRHEPARFIRLDGTKALIAELGAYPEMGTPSTNSQTPMRVINDGENNGTYACRELVIAYAAWISAAFHLKVIRVFLAATTPQAEPTQSRLDYGRINPAQAQDLKEIVAAIVQAGVQTYAETWSRLQRKFRVNSYLELPAQHYGDARAYLLAKLSTRPATTRPAAGKMLVSRQHLASIYTDLGKLRDRIDAMAMPAQDLPPAWMQQYEIKA